MVPGAGTAIGIIESLTKRTRRVERVGAQQAKFSSLVAPQGSLAQPGGFGGGFFPSTGGGPCPGLRSVRIGGVCVDMLALPPGGRPAITPQVGGPVGQVIMGSFGLPAMVPNQVGQIQRANGTVGPILKCNRGFVLGTDNLCYPKQVLPRRSQFRKWRGATRPLISGADVKAIRRAARAKGRVLELAKDIGLHASAKPPSNSAAKELKILKAQHLLAPPTVIVGHHDH